MIILILANNSVGLYKFRKELLEALLAQKCDVYISLPNGDFITEMEQMGCHFIETEISRHGTNPVTDLKLAAKYCNIIKSVKPDMVFTYTIKPNVYGGLACQWCNVPYVVNVTGLGTAVENGGILQKVTLTLYKMGLRKAQKVFFQNVANRKFFIDLNVINGDSALIPGSGVNLERFAPLPYPSSNDEIHFVFISRIMREKGIDQYLDAAEHFHSDRTHKSVFHVCGFCEPEYQGRLQELADKGMVVYHGMVRDVREILKQVIFHQWDMLVRSRVKDYIGLILLEDFVHTEIIAYACNQCRKVQAFAVFHGKLLLNVVSVVFIDIYNNHLLRAVFCNLANEFTSDAAAASRNKANLAFDKPADIVVIELDWFTAKKIFYLNVADLPRKIALITTCGVRIDNIAKERHNLHGKLRLVTDFKDFLTFPGRAARNAKEYFLDAFKPCQFWNGARIPRNKNPFKSLADFFAVIIYKANGIDVLSRIVFIGVRFFKGAPNFAQQGDGGSPRPNNHGSLTMSLVNACFQKNHKSSLKQISKKAYSNYRQRCMKYGKTNKQCVSRYIKQAIANKQPA